MAQPNRPSGPSLSIPAQFSPQRAYTYIRRLPLFTRCLILAIVVLYLLELQTAWSVIEWGALVPQKVGLQSMYRFNTYPLIHLGFFHMLIDTICLIPLLERFEGEWGTLVSLALFMGPFGLLPGAIYVLIDMVILKQNTPILGSSIFVFLLLGSEAIKTYRANPFLDIAGYKIPTWITPLALILITSVLIPGTSFLGHLCGVAVGYVWGLGYIRFLAPPDKVLRWVEGKLNLLGRLPHYVSVDQKTYGRYGVLPTSSTAGPTEHSGSLPIGLGFLGTNNGQRLGP